MKYLIVENDHKIDSYFQSYIDKNNIEATMIFGLEHRSTDEMAEYFTQHEILMFEPTLVTFSQYNGLMMLMYDLLTKNCLAIKEIHIFHHDERIERELRALWHDRRKWLDKVLPHVKIYRIDDIEETKTIINL